METCPDHGRKGPVMHQRQFLLDESIRFCFNTSRYCNQISAPHRGSEGESHRQVHEGREVRGGQGLKGGGALKGGPPFLQGAEPSCEVTIITKGHHVGPRSWGMGLLCSHPHGWTPYGLCFLNQRQAPPRRRLPSLATSRVAVRCSWKNSLTCFFKLERV